MERIGVLPGDAVERENSSESIQAQEVGMETEQEWVYKLASHCFNSRHVNTQMNVWHQIIKSLCTFIKFEKQNSYSQLEQIETITTHSNSFQSLVWWLLALGRLRQDDYPEFEVSFDYKWVHRMRPCLKTPMQAELVTGSRGEVTCCTKLQVGSQDPTDLWTLSSDLHTKAWVASSNSNKLIRNLLIKKQSLPNLECLPHPIFSLNNGSF